MSKNAKSKKSADVSANYDGVYALKKRFPLYVYPETMKTVESLYKSDNCSTKTEFMEKAIRFTLCRTSLSSSSTLRRR